MPRTEPDYLGNPPFKVWREAHPEVRLETPSEAAAGAELIVTPPTAGGSISFLESAGEQNIAGKVLRPLDPPWPVLGTGYFNIAVVRAES
ncbi:MAG: hypothetical protein ACRDNP_04420 [Gaiellaceae bacterium]